MQGDCDAVRTAEGHGGNLDAAKRLDDLFHK